MCHCVLGTLLCYGQTGAGKTFTMAGATENYRHRGIIPRSIAALYRMMDDKPDHSIQVRFVVHIMDYIECTHVFN